MKGKLNFVAGLVLGICLVTGTGAAAAVVETVTATLNRSPIYVDGSRVDLAGYTINGYNYFYNKDNEAHVDGVVEGEQTTSTIQKEPTHR